MTLGDIKALFPNITDDDPAIYLYREEKSSITIIINNGRARIIVVPRGTIRP